MPADCYYYGARISLRPGDVVQPTASDSAVPTAAPAIVRLTSNIDEAIWDAELASGDAAAQVYEVAASGPVMPLAQMNWEKASGRPTMSQCSRHPVRVIREVTAWPLYHGTRASLSPGDLIRPGLTPNYGNLDRTTTFVYASRTLDAATWGAELALGDGAERIYQVEATGALEDDPNVTNKRFRGNPTKSFRSREPLVVIREVTGWSGHAPEALQRMKAHVARLAAQGIEPLD